jgi:hypothetical protein
VVNKIGGLRFEHSTGILNWESGAIRFFFALLPRGPISSMWQGRAALEILVRK